MSVTRWQLIYNNAMRQKVNQKRQRDGKCEAERSCEHVKLAKQSTQHVKAVDARKEQTSSNFSLYSSAELQEMVINAWTSKFPTLPFPIEFLLPATELIVGYAANSG